MEKEMEFYGYDIQQGFLEELLATAVPMATTMANQDIDDDLCNNIINGCWNHQLDYMAHSSVGADDVIIPHHHHHYNYQSSSSFEGCSNYFLADDNNHHPRSVNSSTSSFDDLLLYSSNNNSSSFGSDDLLLLSSQLPAPAPAPAPAQAQAEVDTPSFLPSLEEDNSYYLSNPEETRIPLKMEPPTSSTTTTTMTTPAHHHNQSAVTFSSMGGCGDGVVLSEIRNKSNKKKPNGQPSKNLMAERRRRKRLNERLSMLRSVVPKISKMDRTSILGDTIDYMKELLERINQFQDEESSINQLPNLMGIFKDSKPNEALVRNSPKFDVERRNSDTRIEICCAGKTGLLLSTLTTLESLGLEIQHCVISCFNDFSVQASCSQEMEQMEFLSSEDIKQALFRNAGYGGRCL